MSNKLQISFQQRNLLLNSNFIKLNEPKIYELLTQYKTVSYKIAKENNVLDKIKQNLPLWLDFSSKEWISDKHNPILSKSQNDEDKKSCQLCNTPIKFQYKIKNKENNCILIIGGNCVNTFKELKTMKRIVSNEDEFKRYNELLIIEPYIYDILVTHSRLIDETQIIIPSHYENSFKKINKKAIKIIRGYIRTGKDFDKKEFHRLIGIHKNEVNLIQNFVNQYKNDAQYLSREKANVIKNNQKEDYTEIIDKVKECGGKVLPEISIKIKIEPHLKDWKPVIINRAPDFFNIEKISYGLYTISIKKYNDIYRFNVSSEILLTELFRNKLNNFEEVFQRNFDSFKIQDLSTQNSLSVLAESFITSSENMAHIEVDNHRIVRKYDNDLTAEEYSSIYNKVSKITDKYTLISKKNDNELCVYVTTKLIPFGKKLLFNQNQENKKALINSYDAKLSMKEFEEFVMSQIG